MYDFTNTKIINFIESNFKKYVIDDTAIWDWYVLEYFDINAPYLTIHYHTWEGNDIVKHYIQNSIKIPYTPIIE